MRVVSRNRAQQAGLALNGLAKRGRRLRILFYCEVADVERCMRELKRAHFKVSKNVVLTSKQFTEGLKSLLYDVVVAEYPAPNWQGTNGLELLQKMEKSVPLIYVTYINQAETMAKLIIKGAADCIEMENIGHLPAAIRRVLTESKLREQRDQAERKLLHSEARYQALVGNFTYGICRWNTRGQFLDVNQALVTMLGYASKGAHDRGFDRSHHP